MVHLPGLTGFDDETHTGAGLFLDEMMMDRADEQEGGDRRQIGRGVPVGEHDDLGAVRDGVVDLRADVVEGLAQSRPGLGGAAPGRARRRRRCATRAACRPR